MSDWVWEVDADVVYTHCSLKVESILGYRKDEIIGKTPFDFMPPDEVKRVSAVFGEIARDRKPFRDLENWNITKDGRRVCLLTSGIPILGDDGEFLGYRGVDTDITERKKAQEELEKAQKLESIGTLAAGIAHDFNNMLLGVAGEHLKRLGYSFECAGNGGDAIKLYKMSIKEKKKFDAVILDLTVVGGMGGVATIRNLLEIDPDVKGIVSSGYSDDPVLNEPKKYGFSGKIAKPYLKSELACVLNEVINGK